MHFIAELRISDVFLFPDQALPGRCVVAFRHHRTELFQLTEAERNPFMADLADVASAVSAVSGCDKVNYAAYGDIAAHLHFHIVPKWQGRVTWGDAFSLNPAPVQRLTEEQERQLTLRFQSHLTDRLSGRPFS